MKSVMLVSSVAAVALMGVFAVPAQANECDQMTYLTFSGPVALPRVTLPAGTYRFTHPDCGTTDHVLRVSSKDGSEVYATLLTLSVDRATASDRPEVILGEMPAGAPEAVKAWFFPGETTGDELVYPKGEARIVADATPRKIFADGAF